MTPADAAADEIEAMSRFDHAVQILCTEMPLALFNFADFGLLKLPWFGTSVAIVRGIGSIRVANRLSETQ